MDWLPKTPGELFGAIVVIVVLGSVSLVMLGRIVVWASGWAVWDRRPVNRFSARPARYDNERAERIAGDSVVSPHRMNETEKAGETETAAKLPAGPTSADIKALRDDAHAYALGAALAHGAIPDGSRTAAIRAVFGGITGERYSRIARLVRHHEAQVAATLPSPPAAEPEPARVIPINDGQKGYVEL